MNRSGADEDIVYFDKAKESIILTSKSKKPVFTGISLHSEPLDARTCDMLKQFQKEDLYFFFDDEKPDLNMYAVPILLVFGYDSCGGYFATTDSGISFEKNFPLYYISRDLDMYEIDADSMLLTTGELDWKARLRQTDAVKLYSSRQMAEKDFWIHDVREIADGAFH